MYDSLKDSAAITEIVARFDDAVNRRDVEEFHNLWIDNAIWEICDPMYMHVEGRDTIVETWKDMVAGTKWLFRGSFTGVVRVFGDQAIGRWPCIETGTFLDGRGYDNRSIYEDVYIRTPIGWKFKRRRYLYLWLSNEMLPGHAVPMGEEIATDGSHPSLTRFL